MPSRDYREIPLRRRDGTVRAVVLVDEADFEEVGLHRWCLSGAGTYAVRKKGGRVVLLHRELFGLGPRDRIEVDHINRDKLDNRRANLRLVPIGSQPQNTSPHRDSTSSYRGVSRRGSGWLAQVGKRYENGREINFNLGIYDLEIDAAAVAAQWRHANLEWSNEDPELLKRKVMIRRPPGRRLTEYERFSMQLLQAGTSLSRRQITELFGVAQITTRRVLGPGTKKKIPSLHHDCPNRV